ncbi:LysR family transcriptional regulator [Parvibium lacunae]|uniref:LysR family transcriptional regulator n=1 Tax=Parvibium lacunae TaxID=1888893 RepID=A0A368L1Q4_9BURK|nr:LysR family transcriptional regulator [Parvibium lacunae]RCS57371.1 LysR family transcriptional regulator [Parvibium lacunae]
MEIYQLRSFLAVARLGHLTRAAETLHLSQPAVSKHIKALEEELGIALFERTTSGMALTKAGQLLLTQAERTLVSAVELVNMARKMRGEVAGTIRLGTIIDPEYLRLGEFLGQLLQHYPMLDVKLSHGISGWIFEQVSAGLLDAGFYMGVVNDASIGSIELRDMTYLVVAPPQWASQIAKANWRELACLPWIGTPKQSSQHRLVKQMFEEQNLDMTIVVEADQEASMRNLVASGVGLCLMRDDIAQQAAARGEVVIWEKTKRPTTLSLIYSRTQADQTVIHAIEQVIRDVWGVPQDVLQRSEP